jgi:hypothetical protein
LRRGRDASSRDTGLDEAFLARHGNIETRQACYKNKLADLYLPLTPAVHYSIFAT